MKNEIPSLSEDNSGTYASTGKMETNNKPDIIKFLCGELDYNGVWFGDAIAGKTFWWRSVLRDTIEQRDDKIKSMSEVLAYADEELSRLKTGKESQLYDMIKERDTKIAELERYIHQANGKIIDQFSENQALKSELDKAKEVLISASEFVPFYHMDIVVEIQHVLKDKR